MKVRLYKANTTLNNCIYRFNQALIFCLFCIVPLSCGVYSFTGAATNAKNISIQEFYNNSDLGPANMGQTFTNSIKNYFIQNSNLTLANSEGELQLEGEIMNLTLTPISPTAATGDNNNGITSASATRVTITVKVTYINTLDDKLSFKDKSFSFFRDFTNEQNFSDIEEEFVRTIFDRIINDIFNASVANW